ncbi:twin-arginine translocase TatA/TatE family subunit [Magnetospira sp. QH-2]|uniref:twin-arginine translocase TatA/TatE family subunit n=1 Tax=Magnetospira sp. (strain QH-2) TaxID=1288970 RepID=UPI0003E80F3C|nr:twin-arginine translocase TatA/TatE family subunit [Magnetospira sp. QH-2]CCQ73629.1 TatABCE protein translocation system subunit. Sec-independent protein translocase protein TatA/E [Magnetospira sp. QH-2]
MGTFSIWHWLVVLAVVLILFGGKGKISALMGDLGKGLNSFKKGMKDEGAAAEADDPKAIENEQAEKVETTTTTDKDKTGA